MTRKALIASSSMTLIVLYLISLAAYHISSPAETIVIQSDNDLRSYRYLELSNELRVLLISDPNTDKAAASLDVHVGSRQDPEDYQGLAHFLEHMLFLGTEKYPNAEDYQQFIHTHNGQLNAYTSFEHTNYFFAIDPNYLSGALDRFAQFFIAPLFNSEYVDREKNAVHAEYFASIKNELRRHVDVLQTLANPDHPFTKLAVGNLDTLQDDDQGSLHQALLAFYHENYSANIMTLVVLSQESLDDLQTLVAPLFSAIPNHQKILEPITVPLFNTETLPWVVNIQPEQEQRSLEIIFPLPSAISFYPQKPLHYIANLLGHEGKGSLLAALKARSWAETLTASTSFDYQDKALFTVNITLTEDGFNHVEQVIPTIFQTINRMNRDGIQDWLFAEQQQIANAHFRYQEQISPMSYAMMLANAMQYYPPSDIIIAPYLMKNYDAELIEDFLGYLTPDNSIVIITAPEVEVDTQTHWYQVPYQAKSVDEVTHTAWRDAGIDPAITIPAPNTFICEDLSLVTHPSATDKPQLIIDNSYLKLWFKHDDTFHIPKGSLTFTLLFDHASDSPRHRALLNVLAVIIMDDLNEIAYPAKLAGLHYALSATDRGLLVQLQGFTDKQMVLLTQVLHTLQNPNWSEQQFSRIQTTLIRNTQNLAKEQPYRYLTHELPSLLIKERWPTHQLLSAYTTMTLKSLRAFTENLLQNTSVQALVYGNYDTNDAKKIGDQLQLTGPTSHKALITPTIDIMTLPKQLFSYEFSSNYADGSLLWYLQGANTHHSTRAAMEITAQLLRVDFFKELRTEKQLGYIVTTRTQVLQDVPGMIFLAQSPIVGPNQLRQEILNFINRQSQTLHNQSEAFESYRQTVIQRLSEASKNQAEQATRYWMDIEQGYTDFDSRDQLIIALEALTFEQWLTFFKQQIANEQRGMLLYTSGQFITQGKLDNTLPIGAIELFKAQQSYYSHP